jgi:hypothetical protein
LGRNEALFQFVFPTPPLSPWERVGVSAFSPLALREREEYGVRTIFNDQMNFRTPKNHITEK